MVELESPQRELTAVDYNINVFNINAVKPRANFQHPNTESKEIISWAKAKVGGSVWKEHNQRLIFNWSKVSW